MEDEVRGSMEGEGTGEAARPERVQRPPFSLSALVQADHVEVSKGGILVSVAGESTIDRGASLVSVARNLSVERGGSQWLVAGEARLERSGAGIVLSRHVEAPDAKVAVLIGGEVHGNVQVGVLLAGKVEGNVQTIVDTPTAMRFGAVFGAVLSVGLILYRLLGRR